MEKTYLHTVVKDKYLDLINEGDIIEFEMPPFCSGDYNAKVYKDKHGLYINKADDFFAGARDWNIKHN